VNNDPGPQAFTDKPGQDLGLGPLSKSYQSNRSRESIIQTIAVKHGVALGISDPILMLHTMNDLLLEDMASQQAELLTQFKSSLEETAHVWNGHLDNKMTEQLRKMEVRCRQLAQELCEQQVDILIPAITEKSEAMTRLQQKLNLSNLRVLNRQLSSMRRLLMINFAASLLVLYVAIILVSMPVQ
jgi:hypothetical protein